MTETLLKPATPPDHSERKRLLGRDVASAYLLTFSRVAAWATISAIVYRHAEVGEFVLFVLLRSTVTLFSYTSLGLAPAMIRWFAMAQAIPMAAVAKPPSREVTIQEGNQLDYQMPWRAQNPENAVMSSGFSLCIFLTTVGLVLGACYLWQLDSLHTFPRALQDVAFATASYFVVGTLLRLLSEPMSAVLQSHRAIYIDNILLVVLVKLVCSS